MATEKKTRRMRGEGSVYERSPGVWCGQVIVGHDPQTGRVKRRTVYAKTQDAALKKVEKVRRDLAAGIRETRSPTVEWWLRYWLDNIAAHRVKPRTLLTYRSYVEQHLIPAFGRVKLERLEPHHVRELQRVMAGKSSTTQLHAHRVLANALQAAVRERKITVNVATLVEAPRRAPSPRLGMTSIEARRVMQAAAQRTDSSRWWAALLTGARQGELLGLRWQHVDLDAGLLDLAWALQRLPYSHGCGPADKDGVGPCGRRLGGNCPTRHVAIPAGMAHVPLQGSLYLMTPKTTGSTRVVPMLPALVDQLRRHQATDTGANPHGLVWHRPDGAPINPRADWMAWTALLTEANVEHLTLHECRNTAASLLLDAGVDVRVVEQILGHSLVTTTRHYQTVSVEMARRAVGLLGEQLGVTAPAPGDPEGRELPR